MTGNVESGRQHFMFSHVASSDLLSLIKEQKSPNTFIFTLSIVNFYFLSLIGEQTETLARCFNLDVSL